MKKLNLSPFLEEKIYDLRHNDSNNTITITSYFPLNQDEKQAILNDHKFGTVNFKSVFSDNISESDWQNSKEQIKKKFQDELFNIE